MFLGQTEYLVHRARRVLAGLDDTHLAVEPFPNAKTAGWLVGHLVVTGDYARRWCGRPGLCSTKWDQAFSPGSTPSRVSADYPGMDALIDAFFKVYPDLPGAVAEASEATLARENPYEPARDAYPTVEAFVEYLGEAHLAYHLGQLVAWRAAAGLEPVVRGGDSHAV